MSEREPANPMLQGLSHVIESMSEAVLVIDHHGNVAAINRAALDLLDLHEQRTALRPLDEYDQLIRSWRVGSEPFAPAELRRSLDGQVIPRQVATISTGAGIEHIVQFTATPIRDEQGQIALAMLIFQDITREERTRAYWKAVTTAARALSGEVELGRVLEVVLDQMVEALGGEVAIGVWQTETDDQELRLLASRGLSEHSVARLRSLPLDCPSLICEAGRMRQTRHTDDARQTPPEQELDRRLAEEENLGGLTAAPLLLKDRLLGVMAYGLHASHRMYEEDLQAVSVVSGLFAESIDRAQLHEEMRELNRRLMTTSVREQELAEQFERQAAQLSALLESLTEGVIVADAAGRIVLLNPAARQTWRFPEGPEVLTVEDFRRLDVRRLDDTPLPFAELPINRALRSERFADFEFLVVREDGAQVRLACGGGAVQDEAGDLALAIVVFRDVTELRGLEQTREEYVGLISHDLRNPLANVMGAADWLRRTRSQKGLERETKSADSIVASAKRMNAMIQDLVESSHLEAGRFEMRKEPLNLLQLVSEVVEHVGAPAERARIRIEAPEWVPAVQADPDRIERAIVNLLTNALKYSPPDSPVAVRMAHGDGEAVVSVSDQGVGIPPEELPRLFQRFYRTETTKKIGGLGLGLYITRLIAEAHGGRVWVESEVGKGSTFYLSLPLA